MAVLKYRASDGSIKTLGIRQSGGNAGVTSVNGKTGAVSGLYDAENPPPYPVTSVNGKNGAVTGLYDSDNPPPYPVSSVNGKTGAVTGLYDSANPPPYPVTSVNGKNGAVTGLYDSANQPPYPVTSVNGKTGAVIINEIKVARVTTEVFGDGYRHRFLKSSLPDLNTNLNAYEAILSVINASSVPMISSRFEYDGDYVTVALNLIDGGDVTNSQTLTILYR